MAYTKLGWVNNRAPALNQSNLNHMDQGIYDANSKLSEYEDIFTGDVDESVQNWLDEHPEATTTVEDNSLTTPKYRDQSVTASKIKDGSLDLSKFSDASLDKLINITDFGAIDMDAFRAMTLKAIASYLVHEVGSTCVVGTPTGISQKFVAKYSGQNGVQWAMAKNSNNSFVYTDTQTVDGVTYPVLYSECNTCVNLLTRGITYEESPYLYAFQHTSDASLSHIQYLFMEKGNSNSKVQTLDFLNALTTYRNAYILDCAGSRVQMLGRKVNGEVVYDEDVLANAETGDIVFVSQTGRASYLGIHHIAYYLKDFNDLNRYGADYGVTFKEATETIPSTGEHGYLYEVGGSLSLSKNYIDIFRIRDVDLAMLTGTENDVIYIAKPVANALTSNKFFRSLTGMYSWYDAASPCDRFYNSESSALPYKLFYTQDYTVSYTVSAGTPKWITASELGISIPTGYVFCGYVAFDSGDSAVYTRAMRSPDMNTNVIAVYNTATVAKTLTYTAKALFMRRSFSL